MAAIAAPICRLRVASSEFFTQSVSSTCCRTVVFQRSEGEPPRTFVGQAVALPSSITFARETTCSL